MTIKAGDQVPSVTLIHMTAEGPKEITTDELFKGKKVVVFGLPGAFTPTCSAAHLPGFVVNADKIKARDVDDIVCLSVNDAYVMDAWGKAQNADEIHMVGDGNAEFARAVGLELDRTANLMGIRMKRFAMIVEDGVVKQINVEAPGKFEVSSAEKIMELL